MNLISQVTSKLENHSIESSRINAEIMLCSILGCRRADLYIEDIRLNRNQLKQLDEMVNRRIIGEPLQYITGRVNFYGNEFLIESGVFIPRPETEILVDAVLNSITNYQLPITNYEPLILDLGTGSGNIAISLAKAFTPLFLCAERQEAERAGFTHCKVIGSDISERAIALARRNACLHGVSDRIEFIKANLFDMPERYKGSFDIIVSNPPYIAHEELESLADDVKKEPVQALDGGRYGVNFYSRIIKESHLFLKRDGIIALELADGICDKVRELFKASGHFGDIRVFKDLNSINRVITSRRL